MIKKHLSKNEMEDYRIGMLSPERLIEFDLHLENCEGCRRSLAGDAELSALYDSFMVGINPRELSFLHRFEKFFRALVIAVSSLGRQYQVGMAFAGVLILLGGLLGLNFFWRPANAPFDNQTVSKAGTPAGPLDSNPSNSSAISDEKPDRRPASSVKQSGQKENGLSPQPFRKREVAENRIPQSKMQDASRDGEKIFARVKNLDSDQSASLSGNSMPLVPEFEAKVEVAAKGKKLEIKLSEKEKADQYDFFLADSEKLVKVSRASLGKSKWAVDLSKLRPGRSYVLQVVLRRDGMEIGSIKRKIEVGLKKGIVKKKN